MTKNILSEIIGLKKQTVVNPKEFFVAWSGVLTLAYKGFSSTLLELKNDIKQRIPELKPENSGSIWPKTTLGALRDDKKLSLNDTEKLRNICDKIKPDEKYILEIDQLQIVIFQCRSLEKRLLTYPIRMESASNAIDNIPEWHLKEVNAIINQFSTDNLAMYWKDLLRDGNRESHYRTTHIEATLVYDIPDKHPLHDSIDNFIKEVDSKLQNYFCWFSKESRHMTVRALI